MLRLASLLFAASLLGGCSGEGTSAEALPLQTRETFCHEWSVRACSPSVLTACEAKSIDACLFTQQAFCQDLLVGGFANDGADACLDAVADAYQDAELTPLEHAAVLQLGPPCDRLLAEPEADDGFCSARFDCADDDSCFPHVRLSRAEPLCDQLR